MGQGAYLYLTTGGTVDNWELHGWRIGALVVTRGMGGRR